MQRDWLVFAKHFARRDAENKRVADLAGRAGDSNFNRRSHIILYPQIAPLSSRAAQTARDLTIHPKLRKPSRYPHSNLRGAFASALCFCEILHFAQDDTLQTR